MFAVESFGECDRPPRTIRHQCDREPFPNVLADAQEPGALIRLAVLIAQVPRSEEHTSELQSPYDLVCRLLLEKKKKKKKYAEFNNRKKKLHLTKYDNFSIS